MFRYCNTFLANPEGNFQNFRPIQKEILQINFYSRGNFAKFSANPEGNFLLAFWNKSDTIFLYFFL